MARVSHRDAPPAHAPTEAPRDEYAVEAAATFAMLSDPTRLKLLWLLLHQGESDVGTLAERARTTATATSQHLAKLRLAGLVVQRVDGRRRLYTATGAHLRDMISAALERAEHAVEGVPDHA